MKLTVLVGEPWDFKGHDGRNGQRDGGVDHFFQQENQ